MHITMKHCELYPCNRHRGLSPRSMSESADMTQEPIQLSDKSSFISKARDEQWYTGFTEVVIRVSKSTA